MRGDITLGTGCRNARALARLCNLLEEPLGRVRRVQADELEEVVEAAEAGMTYEELEQYDPGSSFYDPDIGPYYWED